MKYTAENIRFMRRALTLAKKGYGLTFPNPMVGCVIVKDGKIIAEGWHKIFGSLHAEAMALKAAGQNARGADLYVTLEPCSRHGKQPPCSQAVIEHKIKRVFVACADSSQEGINALRQAGITVYTGLLKEESRKLNKAFFNPAAPLVTVKFAMTLDGKIATKDFDSKWITSPQSRALVHRLRTKYDAVLAGYNTVIKDNPFLSSHGKGKNPVRVVIDQNLKIPPSYNVLDGKIPTVVVCADNVKKVPSHFLKDGIVLLKINFAAFKKDFNVLLSALNKTGLKRVFIEGGGETISSALFSGAVNDVYAFVAPVIAGGRAAVSPVEGAGVSKMKDALKLKNIKVKKISSDILIRGIL